MPSGDTELELPHALVLLGPGDRRVEQTPGDALATKLWPDVEAGELHDVAALGPGVTCKRQDPRELIVFDKNAKDAIPPLAERTELPPKVLGRELLFLVEAGPVRPRALLQRLQPQAPVSLGMDVA